MILSKDEKDERDVSELSPEQLMYNGGSRRRRVSGCRGTGCQCKAIVSPTTWETQIGLCVVPS